MRKRALILAGAVVGAGALLLSSQTRVQLVNAADHTDSPSAAANSPADITDFYAWMVDDGGTDTLALIVNVSRNAAADAAFADNIYYTVNLDRGGTTSQVVCIFDATDNSAIRCWVGDEASSTFVQGDPSNAASPLTSGGVSVFAGLREDPFFFNAAGFAATTSAVQDLCVVNNGCGGVLDAEGCPDLSVDINPNDDFNSLGEALVNCLTTQCDQGVGDNTNAAAIDDFADQNVLSLVINVPVAMIPGSGAIAAYASTHTMN